MTNAKAICTPVNDNEVFYGVRKYAGLWVPVIKVNGKRKTFPHCATSYDAMSCAISQAKLACGVAA